MKIVNDDVYGVIQVGAGKGEEYFSYAHLVSNIICFEPVDEEFEILKRNVRHSPYSKYTILSDYVVGNQTGDVPFYIGNNNENSSLLDVDLENNPNNPHSKQIIKKAITLDDFFEKENLDIKKYNMIYMDVQGAEHIVLEGATKILKHIDYIFLEVSYKPIYVGIKVFDDMLDYLSTLGFELVVHNPFFGDLNNKCYQGDILVKKKNKFLWSI
jgi:FkbM family methyltransferase